MPQETKIHGHEPARLEGKTFEPKNFEELVDAVEIAFDYRGDVTIILLDGRVVEGYVFNRESHLAEPYLSMFPKGQTEKIEIFYRDIARIGLTGDDIAFGKSWDAWTKKNADQRKLEAERAAAEAAARGHL
jgi:hypothetical protein